MNRRRMGNAIGVGLLLIAVLVVGAMAVQPAMATDASTQNEGSPALNGSAEVTQETLFTNKAATVTVTYTAPEGETVTIEVADETKTVTADGTQSEVRVRVGAFFFFGEPYPVNVSVSTGDGDTVEGTLGADDGVVALEPPGGGAVPNFQLGELSTNAPVMGGSSLNVTTTVTNTGDRAGIQSVELAVDGVRDRQNVMLDDGTNVSITLTWATEPGEAGNYTATVSTENDTATTGVSVTEATGTITGVVDQSGSPIQNATVVAGSYSTTTAADGTYSLDVPPGEYTVSATPDGLGTATKQVTVTAGETTIADFTLNTEPLPVTGSVTSASGAPISGATVTAGGQSTTTATDGSFSVALDPGEYTFTVTADGFESVSKQITVTWDSITPPPTFTLTSDTGGITGVVTDENGNDIAGATVTVGGNSATTDENGTYALKLSPGEYNVTASAPGLESSTQEATVVGSETTVVDFTLGHDPDPPTTFTAYVRGDESYLHTGTPNDSRPITYPRCRDGEPQPAEQDPDFLPTDDCIQFEGLHYPSNNTWRGTVDIPPVRTIINDTQSSTFGNVYARLNYSTPERVGGTLVPETGRVSLETTVDVNVTLWAIGSIFEESSPAANPYEQVTANDTNRLTEPGCRIPSVQINLSTEKAFQADSPFPATNTVSGQRINSSGIAKLVSDDFAVNGANGCGSVFGIAVDQLVNRELGLPAASGDNEAASLAEFDFGS